MKDFALFVERKHLLGEVGTELQLCGCDRRTLKCARQVVAAQAGAREVRCRRLELLPREGQSLREIADLVVELLATLHAARDALREKTCAPSCIRESHGPRRNLHG